MEKIDRYRGPSDLVIDSEGDLVFYEDHERIVEELQKKHMEEIKEYEENLSYYRELIG